MNIKMIVGAAVVAGAAFAGCGEKNDAAAETKKESAAAPSNSGAPAQVAAQAKAKTNEMAVAVNGVKLMTDTIDADVEAIIKFNKSIPADQVRFARQMYRMQVAQGFVFEQVLNAQAKALGLSVSEADLKARQDEMMKVLAKRPDAPKTFDEYLAKSSPFGAERAKKDFSMIVLVDKLMKAELAKAPATDFTAEAQKIVDRAKADASKDSFSDADALKKITSLKAQLDKVAAKDLPAKFAELAKANSSCPSGKEGGDLHEFTHGQMVKEFDEAAFKLPVNKVSEPVRTQYGYHLIMVTEKHPLVAAKDGKPEQPEKIRASHILIKVSRPQDQPKLEDVVKSLKAQHDRKFFQEYMAKLVKQAKIEASTEFKSLIPPPDMPVAKPVEKKAVQKPAASAEKTKIVTKSPAPVEKPAKK